MTTRRWLLCLVLATAFGTLAGASVVRLKSTQQIGKLTLNMTQGVPYPNVQRTYDGPHGWQYRVVNGQPQMTVDFVNPTVWRCGFEP